jgi:hypothetical protein
VWRLIFYPRIEHTWRTHHFTKGRFRPRKQVYRLHFSMKCGTNPEKWAFVFHVINIGLSPSIVVNRNWIWLSYFNPLVFLLPKTFKLFVFPIFLLWVYLIKVIQEPCCAHSIIYLCLNRYNFVDISADGLYVFEGIIHLLISILVLTWFLGYISWKCKFQKLK